MARTDTVLAEAARVAAKVDYFTARHELQLAEQWATVWQALEPELRETLTELTASAKGGRLSSAKIAKSKRLQRTLSIAAEALDDLGLSVSRIVGADLPDLVKQTAAGELAMVTAQLPDMADGYPTNFAHTSPEAVASIVGRSTTAIHKAAWPLSDEMVKAMKAELIRGVAVGDHPEITARRILKRTEGAFNGGYHRAVNIARTEVLDAHRAAGEAQDKANADVLTGWIWSASLDTSCCIACVVMNGTEHPLTDAGPLGHQSCRCARIPKTRSWADLGFTTVPEPEPIKLPDPKQWFDRQTEARQREVMGSREALQLYKDGAVKWDDLAKRRKNDGWRDSFVPTPTKELRQKAGALL